MIETLRRLRDEIDRVLASLARLEPALAAWRRGGGAENGDEALADTPIPAEAGSSPGGPTPTATTGRQDAPGEGEGTMILPPNGSGTPGEAALGSNGHPKRRPGPRPGQPRLTPEERKAARAQYQRERRARLREAQRTEAEPEVAELEPLRDLAFGERPFRTPHRTRPSARRRSLCPSYERRIAGRARPRCCRRAHEPPALALPAL
jgi:hypothetical protein